MIGTEQGGPSILADEVIQNQGLWLGYIADTGDHNISRDLMERAKVLRGNVYVDELEWLPKSAVDDAGLESDEYDERSRHLVMVDRGVFGFDEPFVFANLRYITQQSGNDPLPVETDFDIVLPVDEHKIEMSRFMSRHFDASLQTVGSVAMISHTVGMLVREGMTGYATLEIPLLKRLKSMGLSVEKLTDAKVLSSYGNTRNYAVRIDGPASLQRAREMSSARIGFPYARLFDIATQGDNEALVGEVIKLVINHKKEEVAA